VKNLPTAGIGTVSVPILWERHGARTLQPQEHDARRKPQRDCEGGSGVQQPVRGMSVWHAAIWPPRQAPALIQIKRDHSQIQKGPVGVERDQYPIPGAVLTRLSLHVPAKDEAAN
jgi:hypothetical protein